MPIMLNFKFTESSPKGDLIKICLIGDGSVILPHLESDVAAHLIEVMTAAQFKGEKNKILAAYKDNHCYLLVGIGKGLEAGLDSERIGGEIFSALKASHIKSVWMPDQKLSEEVVADICYGCQLASYKFDKYFSEKEKDSERVELFVESNTLHSGHQLVTERRAIAEGVFLARDLVFEPANKLFPEAFAARCKELDETGLSVEVYGEAALEELGMRALLAVGRGSCRESQVVTMGWNGGGDEPPIALIGKGVTFDTGGISLKPAKGMEDMKWDMGGAAAVTGAMRAIASRKLPRNVVGIIGLVENMPDGDAQRPGDVVASMSGKTIEVINTDAEGRLVLADLMHYAQSHFRPQAMIDLATLTGAIIAALGKEHAGLFSNSDDLASQLVAAGKETAEDVWQMPMGASYDKMLKSHIADMKNIGGPFAGAITAACFLNRFVDEIPWAHLDIAGKAWSNTNHACVPKGGTGYGVRLLNKMLDNWSGESFEKTRV